ncbi:phage antirepressor [Pseudomonas nicosulfuronedens]|uniref:phage antirepressor n=1 Tax=Pseudomonas nicosulfuronedens TaxID=2571105 RepID=UPI00244822B0|nr:phage antirepressor [Pseudomonas nicosulfuronedens]MDH1012325.1 phage antirepressor [Pseudomonas nicosulfuronedens]MDH2030494.1 phage antirepressor [Pseudomonas nicosulfuronedens]
MSLQVFNFSRRDVRVVVDEHGELWFVGKDVCDLLGYTNASKAMGDHCKGVTKRYPLATAGGTQEVRVLSEPDTLRLIVNSKLPAAQEFERWVFEEVLPTIRRTGGYGKADQRADISVLLENPKVLQRLLLEKITKVEQLEADNDDLHTENQMLEQKVVADAPKVEFANTVVVTHETYSVGEAAKLIGTGQNRLMSFLRMKGWVCVRKNEPKQWAIERGYLSAKLHSYEHPTKGPTVESTARVTGKGLVKLRELWLQRDEDLLSGQVGGAM